MSGVITNRSWESIYCHKNKLYSIFKNIVKSIQYHVLQLKKNIIVL